MLLKPTVLHMEPITSRFYEGGRRVMLSEEHKDTLPLDAIWIYSESDPDQAGTILERPKGTVSKGAAMSRRCQVQAL